MRVVKNNIELTPKVTGNLERLEHINDVLEGNTFLPKTVSYKDIDTAFRDWVESLAIYDDNNQPYPTVPLFSNQRFSEYSKTWEHTDANQNLLLNFKTFNREPNPQFGEIQSRMYNIPDDNYIVSKTCKVLDNNGTESLLVLKSRQPLPVDMFFKVSIFTTEFNQINKFNMLVNTAFRSRQCYLVVNGHHMPMVLESATDKSEYSINDRQFFSQIYKIKLLGYVIQEDDFKYEEIPLRRNVTFPFLRRKKMSSVEIETDCDTKSPFYGMPISLNITFPLCTDECEFTFDTDMVLETAKLDNMFPKYTIKVNNELVHMPNITLHPDDVVYIRIHRRKLQEAVLTFFGKSPTIIYDERKDNPEFTEDSSQPATEITITS